MSKIALQIVLISNCNDVYENNFFLESVHIIKPKPTTIPNQTTTESVFKSSHGNILYILLLIMTFFC